MMTKRLVHLSSAISLALLMVGCGSSGDGGNGTGGMSGLADGATAGIDGQSGTRNWQ